MSIQTTCFQEFEDKRCLLEKAALNALVNLYQCKRKVVNPRYLEALTSENWTMIHISLGRLMQEMVFQSIEEYRERIVIKVNPNLKTLRN